jgi:hypothetical protein
MPDEPIDYKKLYEQEQKKVSVLQKKVLAYEGNGPAKLYYSLNRKQWEMAELLNREDLTSIDIDDPKSKTFDRLKVILKEGAEMGVAVNSLGMALGMTGDEVKDTSGRQRMTPESVAESIGDIKSENV